MSASDGRTASEWVPTGSVTVRVPGKVNLYLAVGDRRDDGYHELTTVFHAVSLLDEVTVSNADMLMLELTGEGEESLPTDERNLAWRAAELMADQVGRAPDVAISIEKSIPVSGEPVRAAHRARPERGIRVNQRPDAGHGLDPVQPRLVPDTERRELLRA